MVGRGSLTPLLFSEAQRIEALARGEGLDFFEVVFEMLDAGDVNGVAAYGGFPVRYPSWRFGMEYERLDKGYSFGLSKIYELVINNDPTYAYLVRTNTTMEQKLVMAHVFGHADFFKHNVWFKPTERRMVDRMGSNGTRVRQMIDQFGQERVETFLDLALSLDNLVDPYLPMRTMRRREQGLGGDPRGGLSERIRPAWLSPSASPRPDATEHRLPSYDILGFLAAFAPVEPWQRRILEIVREEAYYFMPQRMTKIANEGWASYWHSRLLTGKVLGPDEVVDFADCHSGATASVPGQLNPYKLGIQLFRYAESQGRDLFALRAVHNDASLIDELVDEQFARQTELYVYGRNPRTGQTEVLDHDWRKVKASLLRDLAWGGLPKVELVLRDFEQRGELELLHHHDGRDLELEAGQEIVRSIASLWKRPVHLVSAVDGEEVRIVSDGETAEVKRPSDSAPDPELVTDAEEEPPPLPRRA